jgi:ubiquinone/menaquinone biosynthesis C-methylase UbiE
MSLRQHFEKFAVKYSVVRNDVIRVVPKPLLKVGLKFLCVEVDAIDSLFNRRSDLTPPCSLRIQTGPFIDAKYYEANGEEFFGYFKSLCKLQPKHQVLDIGCGWGQLAGPLSRYMDANGTYEGFDIVREMIEWCAENISLRYENFHFHFADVFNKHYNPKGRTKASDYRFPYDDRVFDFVFLKSVFTHMLPEDMGNYLSEISRVLKKSGKCLASYFLLNKESLKLMDSGDSSLSFCCVMRDCRVNDANNPEFAVAYDEEYVRALFNTVGLKIQEPVSYGSWCRRKAYLSYQDIVVASKRI